MDISLPTSPEAIETFEIDQMFHILDLDSIIAFDTTEKQIFDLLKDKKLLYQNTIGTGRILTQCNMKKSLLNQILELMTQFIYEPNDTQTIWKRAFCMGFYPTSEFFYINKYIFQIRLFNTISDSSFHHQFGKTVNLKTEQFNYENELKYWYRHIEEEPHLYRLLTKNAPDDTITHGFWNFQFQHVEF